jgi:predicted O-methyltransferase YrrM
MNADESFFPPRPTALAHELLEKIIRLGDTVVDATAGNGHDTLFLAAKVGEAGRVWAFDVREEALRATARRLEAAGFAARIALRHDSHERMADHLTEGSVSVVMFNLGYLPGGDHTETTEKESTLAALEVVVRLLMPGGALSIICYPGHEAGADEAAAVEGRMTRLAADGWRVARYQALGTRRPAPLLLIASKPQAS